MPLQMLSHNLSVVSSRKSFRKFLCLKIEGILIAIQFIDTLFFVVLQSIFARTVLPSSHHVPYCKAIYLILIGSYLQRKRVFIGVNMLDAAKCFMRNGSLENTKNGIVRFSDVINVHISRLPRNGTFNDI